MKKRNLLTLTALCMSLGLVVTACQGPAGTKGEKGDPGAKGDTGDKGDKGDKGDPGEKGDTGEAGKTYLAVIVADWRTTGGKITQDKYFIEPGESFTLTFEPGTGNDLVLDFTVNGEKVTIEPTQTTWSPEDTTDAKGYQVWATFTNAIDYAIEEIKEFYNGLVEDDNQISTLTVSKDRIATLTAPSYASDYVSGCSGALATLNEIVKTSIEGVESNISGDSPLARLTKANDVIKEAKSAIQQKYNAYLNAAQEKAKANLSGLVGELKSSVGARFKDDDKAAFLNTCNAAIEACTSVQAVATYVNSVTDHVGTYNKAVALKTSAYNAVASALAEANTQYGSDATSIQATYDAVKGYVSDIKLPKDIADEYDEQISAAGVDGIKEVTTEGTTGTDVGDAATKDLKASYETVKTALVAAIKQSYIDEILACQKEKGIADSVVNRLESYVETAVSDWVLDNDNPKLKDYVDTSSQGLIYAIESKLADDKIADLTYSTYRVEKAKASVISKFKEKITTIKADSLYVTAIAGTKGNDGKYTGVTKELGTTCKVTNPVYTVDGTDDSKFNMNNVTVENVKSATNVSTSQEQVPASVDAWFDTLNDVKDFSNATMGAGDLLVVAVKKWGETHLGDFDKIYAAVKTNYIASAKQAAVTDLGSGLTYFTNESLQNNWDNQVSNKNMAEVSTLADTLYSSAEALKKLDTAIKTFVDAKVSGGDTLFSDYFGQDKPRSALTDNKSTFRDAVDGKDNKDSLLNKVLEGKAKDTDYNDDALQKLYDADLAPFFVKAKETLERSYYAWSTKATTVALATELDEVYEAWTKFDSEGKAVTVNGVTYKNDTFTAVNTWLGDAQNALEDIFDYA